MEQNFRNELNQAIDFSSVLTQISAFSSFSCAKEKILNALPVFDKLEIQEQLNYAKEAIQFEQAGGLLSLSGANDISLPVSKASKQMTLTSKELISIYHFLTAVKQAWHGGPPITISIPFFSSTRLSNPICFPYSGSSKPLNSSSSR